MPIGRRVDRSVSMEAPGAGRQIDQRVRALDLKRGQAERTRDMFRGPLSSDEAGKGVPAPDLIGIESAICTMSAAS